MKKILIIIGGDFHFPGGGTENYNLFLLQILNKYYQNYFVDILLIGSKNTTYKLDIPNCKFIYLPTHKNPNKSTLLNIFNLIKDVKMARKYLHDVFNDYDLILDSSLLNCKFKLNLSKYYLIQHFYLESYYFWSNSSSFSFSKLMTFFWKFFMDKLDFLKDIANFVVFNEETAKTVKKINLAINTYPICLPSRITPIAVKELSSNSSRIIFLGRIDNHQKNISSLIKINQQVNMIDFYGDAFDKEGKLYKKQLINLNWYKGVISSKESLINTLHHYKFMILYSKYEGFPFSLVEALSQGIPIIVKNTYLSASFLCNDKTGLLLPKNTSVEEDIQLIKKFISMDDKEYHQYQINCVNFYNERLNINIFISKWRSIFDQYLDKK